DGPGRPGRAAAVLRGGGALAAGGGGGAMSVEPEGSPARPAPPAGGAETVPDEFLPFLEGYEEVLRRGEALTPGQWLLGDAPFPRGLRDALHQLRWLYGPGDGGPAPAGAAALPAVVGYEVLEMLSRGGMGV